MPTGNWLWCKKGIYHSLKKRKKTQFCCYLRCKVLWRPTESFHGGTIFDPLLTQAKVCDLNVSVFVQHEVFQLKKTGRRKISDDDNEMSQGSGEVKAWLICKCTKTQASDISYVSSKYQNKIWIIAYNLIFSYESICFSSLSVVIWAFMSRVEYKHVTMSGTVTQMFVE